MSNPSPAGPRSAALLARLQGLPRLTLPVITLVLFLVAAFAPLAYAVPALVLLLALIGWLASLSWPLLDRPARLLRVVAIGALAVLLIGRVVQALG
ncbi:DUF6703 family protein [Solicola gregarius]|uniref:Uncharacterized protein n=1 Tax=Solicola gregarius TaxID=2908642 RepID=A0AA46YLN5_9ACTN|nr:DUF6703 family protein [Solicola gregarius]UYM05774.1 hypothetical protein L0C25_01465 [Solicola gregarius]